MHDRLRSFCILLLTLAAGGLDARQVTAQTGVRQAGARQTAASAPGTGEIVARMMASDAERSRRCQHYISLRDYHIVYRGFPGKKEAAMQVEMTYNAPGPKRFHVISTSGSKVLIDRVLKKLIESEQEASGEPTHTALTPANYTFQFEMTEQGATGKQFVLWVTPKVDSKFLYRGKVWVDAKDYAVTRIEAEPAKNPSFWITNVEIRHTYKKVDGCWLPGENQSVTKVRLGGVANLTIMYPKYEMGGGS